MMVALAEKVPLIYENPDKFTEWLERMSKAGVISYKVERYKNGVVLWQLKGRLNTGISTSADPINNLVLLGFAFFGPFWAYLPDADRAFKYIRKWWRRQIKERKKF